MLYVKYFIKNKYIKILIYDKNKNGNILYNEFFIKNQFNWFFIKNSIKEFLYEVGLIKFKKN